MSEATGSQPEDPAQDAPPAVEPADAPPTTGDRTRSGAGDAPPPSGTYEPI